MASNCAGVCRESVRHWQQVEHEQEHAPAAACRTEEAAGNQRGCSHLYLLVRDRSSIHEPGDLCLRRPPTGEKTQLNFCLDGNGHKLLGMGRLVIVEDKHTADAAGTLKRLPAAHCAIESDADCLQLCPWGWNSADVGTIVKAAFPNQSKLRHLVLCGPLLGKSVPDGRIRPRFMKLFMGMLLEREESRLSALTFARSFLEDRQGVRIMCCIIGNDLVPSNLFVDGRSLTRSDLAMTVQSLCAASEADRAFLIMPSSAGDMHRKECQEMIRDVARMDGNVPDQFVFLCNDRQIMPDDGQDVLSLQEKLTFDAKHRVGFLDAVPIVDTNVVPPVFCLDAIHLCSQNVTVTSNCVNIKPDHQSYCSDGLLPAACHSMTCLELSGASVVLPAFCSIPRALCFMTNLKTCRIAGLNTDWDALNPATLSRFFSAFQSMTRLQELKFHVRRVSVCIDDVFLTMLHTHKTLLTCDIKAGSLQCREQDQHKAIKLLHDFQLLLCNHCGTNLHIRHDGWMSPGNLYCHLTRLQVTLVLALFGNKWMKLKWSSGWQLLRKTLMSSLKPSAAPCDHIAAFAEVHPPFVRSVFGARDLSLLCLTLQRDLIPISKIAARALLANKEPAQHTLE